MSHIPAVLRFGIKSGKQEEIYIYFFSPRSDILGTI